MGEAQRSLLLATSCDDAHSVGSGLNNTDVIQTGAG